MRVMLHSFTATSFADDDLHISLCGPFAVRGRSIARLSAVEKRLLVLLAANAGLLVGHDEAIEAIYGDDEGGGPDEPRFNIKVAIDHLRTVAPAFGFRVDTQWGRGYRLELLKQRLAA